MKVVILAGGLPSNISDENDRIPKPMVNIGERPMLWHIMKMYSYYGYNDFLVCAGYRGDMIKKYFMDYYIYRSDVTIDLEKNDIEIHNNMTEPWNVTIVDTGLNTGTAERVKKAMQYIDDEEFIVSYGDCVSDMDINKFVNTYKKSGKGMTVALARPTGRNEVLHVTPDGKLLHKEDKDFQLNAWVNACNMVVNKAALEQLHICENDRFEAEIVDTMIQKDEVEIYKHNGFWLPVETMRDKILLQSMWDKGNIPWKVWND